MSLRKRGSKVQQYCPMYVNELVINNADEVEAPCQSTIIVSEVDNGSQHFLRSVHLRVEGTQVIAQTPRNDQVRESGQGEGRRQYWLHVVE